MPHTGFNPEPTSLIYIEALEEPEPPGAAHSVLKKVNLATKLEGGGWVRP